MMYDLVIQGGKIITSQWENQANLAILDGKIAAIGFDLPAEQTFDASGMLVIPGGVDPHVHINTPIGTTRTSDDWNSGTRPAVIGGTTTVIDFVEPEPDQTLLEALDARRKEAEGKSWVDYTFHMTLVDGVDSTLAQIPQVVEAGINSFKVYTIFPGFKLDDKELLSIFSSVAKIGGMVLVHAENDAIVQYSTQFLIEEHKLSPSDFPLSHPPEAEIEAIQRVIQLAKVTGVRLYIVHISTAEGAEAVENARLKGFAVYGETCPQYLLLDKTCYEDKDLLRAVGFVCNPPLRTLQDQQILWKMLAKAKLQTVGTDHCAFNRYGQKDQGLISFLNAPPGLPGIEARLGLIYTFGVKTGLLTKSEWVSRCSTEAAKLFGLFPQKGDLNIGADADIVIFDPEKEAILSKSNGNHSLCLHDGVDYSPYEGIKVSGWPFATFHRGRLVVCDQKIIEGNPAGIFLSRGE